MLSTVKKKKSRNLKVIKVVFYFFMWVTFLKLQTCKEKHSLLTRGCLWSQKMFKTRKETCKRFCLSCQWSKHLPLTGSSINQNHWRIIYSSDGQSLKDLTRFMINEMLALFLFHVLFWVCFVRLSWLRWSSPTVCVKVCCGSAMKLSRRWRNWGAAARTWNALWTPENEPTGTESKDWRSRFGIMTRLLSHTCRTTFKSRSCGCWTEAQSE